MLRSWYGVTPTGNQAIYAIGQLAKTADEYHDEAGNSLKTILYVDNLMIGLDSTEDLDKIIEDMRYILQEGDFRDKFICKSRENPYERASPDGEAVKVLGYVWRYRKIHVHCRFPT